MINRAWNSVTENNTPHDKVILPLIAAAYMSQGIFSHDVNLKTEHWFHDALPKVCSDHDDTVRLKELLSQFVCKSGKKHAWWKTHTCNTGTSLRKPKYHLLGDN